MGLWVWLLVFIFISMGLLGAPLVVPLDLLCRLLDESG